MRRGEADGAEPVRQGDPGDETAADGRECQEEHRGQAADLRLGAGEGADQDAQAGRRGGGHDGDDQEAGGGMAEAGAEDGTGGAEHHGGLQEVDEEEGDELAGEHGAAAQGRDEEAAEGALPALVVDGRGDETDDPEDPEDRVAGDVLLG